MAKKKKTEPFLIMILMRVADYIELILKKGELSSPLRVRGSKNVPHVIQNTECILDHSKRLTDSEKAHLKEFLNQFKAITEPCINRPVEQVYLLPGWKDRLICLEGSVRDEFLPEIRNMISLRRISESKELPPPIDTKGLWERKDGSLSKLREIDSNNNRDGITGSKKDLSRLKQYVKKRGPKREDIAETLYYENGRIKTSMPHRSMFKQK